MTSQRKNIAVFTSLPEATHERRIVRGIAAQCAKYGYNALVFAPMTHVKFPRKAYGTGENRIYGLANLDLIDGVILDTTCLLDMDQNPVMKEIRRRLDDYPDLPVVALEMSVGDYPLILNHNEPALRDLCRHAIEVHGKKDLCILTGPKGNEIAEVRLSVFLDEIERHGITVTDEHIVYGDFWYTSGDKLAKDLLDGRISMPEAVLCASDHMALGLIDRLQLGGLRVPEDLIVLSFDTTDEGRVGDVILSSYEAGDTISAADAVDHIRRIIDPDGEILPYQADVKTMFHPGMSCGCAPNLARSLEAFRSAVYFTHHNVALEDRLQTVDIGLLMESYAMEDFTAARTPEECFAKIKESTYLLRPYVRYYLCLKEGWLDPEETLQEHYPDRMRLVITCGGEEADQEPRVFETAKMLPQLWEETFEPCVFYFSPVHFEGMTLGYSVLQRAAKDVFPLNLVYRSWLRFVNNALEMIRAKGQLFMLSVRDSMTGLYNRRGMEIRLRDLLSAALPGDSLFVGVIDMDGLKMINDTYGHSEGDFGIRLVGKALAQSAGGNEISIRAGGDEFYLIGVGRYEESMIPDRIRGFEARLKELAAAYRKPYEVSASVGIAIRPVGEDLSVDAVISRADEVMYESKVARKKERRDL